MSALGRHRRSGQPLVMAAAALLLGGLAPIAVTAATLVTFDVQLYYNCLNVHGPANTTVDIAQRGSSGELRFSTQTQLDGSGQDFACVDQLLPTDRIIAKWGVSSSKSFTIPVFSIDVDRVGDIVKGRAPANSTVEVSLQTENAIPPGPLGVTKIVPTGASGSYSADFTSVRNMRGGDAVTASWTAPSGDSVFHEIKVPFMVVAVRSARLDAWIDQYQSATFQLRTSGGSLRATTGDRADEEGELEGLFWMTSGGSLVQTAVGDMVTASFASDATLTIPNLTINGSATTDVVSGLCIANRRYWINVFGPSGGGFRIGNAGPTGAYSEDFTTDYDIQKGDQVTVHCMFGSGDQVVRRTRAN